MQGEFKCPSLLSIRTWGRGWPDRSVGPSWGRAIDVNEIHCLAWMRPYHALHSTTKGPLTGLLASRVAERRHRHRPSLGGMPDGLVLVLCLVDYRPNFSRLHYHSLPSLPDHVVALHTWVVGNILDLLFLRLQSLAISPC